MGVVQVNDSCQCFDSLYLIYPRCSPNSESEDLKRLQALVPSIEDGEGRTVRMQAIYQLIGLIVTLSIAMIGGALTGKYKFYKFIEPRN